MAKVCRERFGSGTIASWFENTPVDRKSTGFDACGFQLHLDTRH
jgi:hypothetical protein